MSSVNLSNMYMASDKVVAEHNQAELGKLEAQTANSILALERLARLLGQLGLKCE